MGLVFCSVGFYFYFIGILISFRLIKASLVELISVNETFSLCLPSNHHRRMNFTHLGCSHLNVK